MKRIEWLKKQPNKVLLKEALKFALDLKQINIKRYLEKEVDENGKEELRKDDKHGNLD